MKFMTNYYEQPPFDDRSEPATYIKDVDLAHDMAHAEKPFRDAIFQLGKAVVATPPEAIRSLKESANKASNLVGREYVAQEQAKLNDYVAGEQAKLDELRTQFGEADDSGVEQPKAVETLGSVEQWAVSVRTALAERYDAPPEAFELVSYTDDNGRPIHAVTHTGPNGIDLGDPKKDYDPARSYRKITKHRNEHQVTIDGRAHSTLAMNYPLYEAMVAKAKQEERELPDSAANRLPNDWYTWTLMPAEPLAGGVAPRIAWVRDGGSVRRDWTDRDRDYRVLRFRPAVVYTEEAQR